MSERNGYEHGVPCWVDNWQDDLETAVAFYTGVFGWQADVGDRYTRFRLRGRDVAGAGAPALGADAAWTTYVWVDDADATAARVTANGGSVVRAPFDSLDGGRMAIVADPQGAVFAVWQLGEHRGAELVNEPSAWSMSELVSPDPEAAEAFYGAVFGWEPEPFGDIATMLRLPGFVGGEPEQPVPRDTVAVLIRGDAAHWHVGFWIDDVDAAAERAAALGGQVLVAPHDGAVGREAVLADPAGAAFSVSRVVPPGPPRT